MADWLVWENKMDLIKIYVTQTPSSIIYHYFRWYDSDTEILGNSNILNSIYWD